jgi:hypothetical protein
LLLNRCCGKRNGATQPKKLGLEPMDVFDARAAVVAALRTAVQHAPAKDQAALHTAFRRYYELAARAGEATASSDFALALYKDFFDGLPTTE